MTTLTAEQKSQTEVANIIHQHIFLPAHRRTFKTGCTCGAGETLTYYAWCLHVAKEIAK